MRVTVNFSVDSDQRFRTSFFFLSRRNDTYFPRPRRILHDHESLIIYNRFIINGVMLNLVRAYAKLIMMFYGAKSLSSFIFCTPDTAYRKISSKISTEVRRKEERNARNVSTYHLSLKKNILTFFSYLKKICSAFFRSSYFCVSERLEPLKYS